MNKNIINKINNYVKFMNLTKYKYKLAEKEFEIAKIEAKRASNNERNKEIIYNNLMYQYHNEKFMKVLNENEEILLVFVGGCLYASYSSYEILRDSLDNMNIKINDCTIKKMNKSQILSEINKINNEHTPYIKYNIRKIDKRNGKKYGWPKYGRGN